MDLPKGWEAVDWLDIVTITHGQNQKEVSDPNGAYPIYGSGGQIGKASRYLCKAGSTVVGRKGTINKPFFAHTDFWNIDTAFGITPHTGVLPKYLFFFCLHFDFGKLDTSTTIPSLTQKNLYSIRMPLPPLAEQHRIVARIDALFSKLDKGVETLQMIRQQLKTYRQAVLKWAFDNTTFEKHSLKKVSIAFSGAAFKSSDFLSKGKYQVVKIGNVRPGVVRLWEKPAFIDSIDGYERYLLQKGDVIITLTGTRKKRDYGFSAIITQENLLLNQRVAAIRFSKEYLPKFFMYYSWTKTFQDDFFANETGNVGQGNVGMKAITETLVPYCSLEEQAQIVAAIESRLSVCDKLESIVDENLAKAAALRQSILKKAFSGQLVPQDPDDEPAEMLLKRIKAGTPPQDFIDGNGSSVKRNPLLAQLMYYVKDIESFGTGIKRISNECIDADIKVEFEIRKMGFAVIFHRPVPAGVHDARYLKKVGNQYCNVGEIDANDTVKGTAKDTANADGVSVNVGVNTTAAGANVGVNADGVGVNVGVNDTQNKILVLLATNPRFTAQQLSDHLGITKRRIESNVKALRELNLIERKGSDKNGHWVVNLPENAEKSEGGQE